MPPPSSRGSSARPSLFDGGFLGGHRFADMGVNIRMLEPGQKSAMYHREPNQEAFLVLAGECLLIVEDEERPLRQWDFVHSPAGTAHVVIGAGDGPCWVLMVGRSHGGCARAVPGERRRPAPRRRGRGRHRRCVGGVRERLASTPDPPAVAAEAER